MTLTDRLAKAALESSSGITFIHASGMDEWCSYKYLYEQALSILGQLQQKGIQPGDELIIQAEDNKQLLAIFWGCILGKIIPVPMSVGTQSEQKLKTLNIWKYLSNPYWTCDEQQAQRIRSASLEQGRMEEYEIAEARFIPISSVVNSSEKGNIVPAAKDDIAYIQFSSGSTAEPKGVCLTHDNLLCNISDIVKSLEITGKDTLLSWMPLTHDMGLIGFHLTGLIQHINIVSISTSLFIRRPLIWMDKVVTYSASVLYAPNFGLQYFLSALQKDNIYSWNLACVRLIVNGAESISSRLCTKFINTMKPYGLHGKPIVAAYGLAEASVEVTCMPVGTDIICHYLHREYLNIGNTVQVVRSTDDTAVGFVDVGYPVSNCMVRICDDDELILPEDTVGHIQIKGGNVTAGYYNNPAATATVFTKDHWLRTGDIGFLRSGRLVITGRLKNIIILNGQNYYPQDIEQIITDAGIAEIGKVAACGYIDRKNNKEELLVFLLHKGDRDAFTGIAKMIREVIAKILGIITSKVIAVKRIPKTTSGKVQYFMLLEHYRNGAYVVSDEPYRDSFDGDIKESLIHIVSSLLGSENINGQSNLLEYGLSSLIAVQIAGRIHELTGAQIPVGIIFEHTTIDEILRYIERTESRDFKLIKTYSPSGACFDLSLAQKRIWMECQLHKDLVAYNIPLVFRISGSLSIDHLETAMKCLIRKYEILRTSFELVDGQPQQRVHSYNENLFLLKAIDAPESINTWMEWCEHEANQPFSLDVPSQFRMSVINREKNEYVLSFVIHHILIDGWSLVMLLRELRDIYNHLLTNMIPSADELLPVQFREYVFRQKEMISNRYIYAQQKYWENEIKGLPEPVSLLPGTTVRKRNQRIQTAFHHFSFNGGDWDALQALSKHFEATPFCILMALLNLIVYRYTRQKDIVTGFNSMGRTTSEMERCIGYALNTLCLRMSMEDGQSFSDLVMEVKGKIFSALDHQLYPFEQLLEDSRLKEGVYKHSLFSMLVLYQNFYRHDFDLGFYGCKSAFEHMQVKEGFVDLLLEFTEDEQKLSLLIQYNKELFTFKFIDTLTAHLLNLLREVVVDGTRKIDCYDFLSQEEKAVLLKPDRTKLPDIPGTPVHQLFEKQAKEFPGAIAICTEGKEITYKELNDHANRIAFLLRKGGKVRPDDRIGFMVGRNEKMIISILAILKAGGAYVPIDAELPMSRWKRMVKDSGMCYLLTDNENIGKLKEEIGSDILINLDDDSSTDNKLDNPPFEGTERSLAYVVYTSGSTGEPKGVMVEHRSLSGYVEHFIQYFAVNKTDIFIQQASVSFDTIIEEIFPALCTSAKIVIAENGGRDINGLLDKIAANKVTILSTTPLVLNEINAVVDDWVSSLRVVISGGDVLYSSNINNLFNKTSIYNTYGPTEGTVCAAYKQITTLNDAGLIGKPIKGRHIYILDEHQQLMPIGLPGEICIEGGLARGYLNLASLTDERFIPNPFNNEERLYRTGDIGMFTESDEIAFLGRNDLQVKVHGYRVEIGEIEKLISGYTAIESSAVIWEKESEQLVAFLKVKEELSVNHLRSYISEQLPFYMIPHQFIIMDALPVTINGKADRNKLMESVRAGVYIQRKKVLPSSNKERELLELVKSILKADDLGVTDNFFEWGCNSIKAVRIIELISRSMQCKLDLKDIFIYPSVELLVGQIEKQGITPYEEIPVVSKAASYALSSAQQRLWILNRIEEHSVAYNEGELFEISGEIDVALLRKSLQTVTERHEVLRTTFEQINSTPRQIVHDPALFPLNFIYKDMSDCRPEEVKAALSTKMQEVFNLQKAPAYRFILIKHAESKYFFTVVMHHIITDDWSCRVLIKDFTDVYNALKDGKPDELPECSKITYKDYADWSLKTLEDRVLAADRQYWMDLFSTKAPVANIPTDFKRLPGKSRAGSRRAITINQDTRERLYTYCKSQQVSLFMLLVSCLGGLLSRYTGECDVVIGTPMSGREHPDLNKLIGFFINTLPLRLQLDFTDTLEVVLHKVKNTCLGAYAHRNYPFDRLINEVDLARDLSRPPMFDVLINLSTFEQDADIFTIDGATFQRVERPAVGSKYDLTFYFEEYPDRLSLLVEYDSNLFSESRISRMTDHYINFLNAFPEYGTLRLGEVEYLNGNEREQLLRQSNGDSFPFQPDSIIKRIAQQAGKHSSKPAVICGGNSYTYDYINTQSDILAEYIIRHHHICPDDKVCLLLNRTELVIITILAIWKAGAAYVPVDPGLPENRINYIINDTGASLVVTDTFTFSRLRSSGNDHSFSYLCADNIPFTEGHVRCADLSTDYTGMAYVMYTSGSTGEPKGVMVSHTGLLNVLDGLQKLLDVTENDIMLSVSAYTFDISLSEFFLPLISGAQLVMAYREEVLETKSLKALFEGVQPTLMQATPALWSILVSCGWKGSTRLKAITCGEPLSDELKLNLLQRTMQLWNLYGPTEATIFSSGKRIADADEPVTIGFPFYNTAVYILDYAGQLVPEGVFGELYIGGQGVAYGYLNQAALTNKKFVDNIFTGHGKMYATGDIGRWLPDGRIEYAGRADHQVKLRGFRIELGEIEKAILELDNVASTAVVLTGKDDTDKEIIAYVVYKDGVNAYSEHEIRLLLQQQLPSYMIPGRFIRVAALPVTSSGKIDRKLLAETGSAGQTPHENKEFLSPQSKSEKLLLLIWRDLLHRDDISTTDSFFDLGGHSLLANKLVNKIYAGMGVEVKLSDVFSHPTIVQMGKLVAQMEQDIFDYTEL